MSHAKAHYYEQMGGFFPCIHLQWFISVRPYDRPCSEAGHDTHDAIRVVHQQIGQHRPKSDEHDVPKGVFDFQTLWVEELDSETQ